MNNKTNNINPSFTMAEYEAEKCPECDNGRIQRYYENWRCNKCKGTGKVLKPRDTTCADMFFEVRNK